MSSVRPSIFARDDTMFGVCEALGEDLGISANALRVAIALALFGSPVAAAATYAGLGVLVFVLRWLVPDSAAPEAEDAAADTEAGAAADWPYAEAA